MAYRCLTQPNSARGLGGGAVSPQRGPGQSPGGKRIVPTIYCKLAKNQVSGCRLHPNYSNFLENIISSSMYDTISSGVMI